MDEQYIYAINFYEYLDKLSGHKPIMLPMEYIYDWNINEIYTSHILYYDSFIEFKHMFDMIKTINYYNKQKLLSSNKKEYIIIQSNENADIFDRNNIFIYVKNFHIFQSYIKSLPKIFNNCIMIGESISNYKKNKSNRYNYYLDKYLYQQFNMEIEIFNLLLNKTKIYKFEFFKIVYLIQQYGINYQVSKYLFNTCFYENNKMINGKENFFKHHSNFYSFCM